MLSKEYVDPELGSVILSKSAVSRRISIRVHPSDGIKIIVPRSLSYDEGLRFFMQKRDWVIGTVEKQKKKIADAVEQGKALRALGNGSTVRTLMSEIIFRRDDSAVHAVKSEAGPMVRTGKIGSENGKTEVRIQICAEQVEDVKSSGRTWLSLDRPLFRKTLTYSGNPPEEGSPALDEVLRRMLVEVLRNEAKIILPRKAAFFADRFGFSVGRVTVKHNSSNWGSCSRRGNINLNLNLVRLPEPLCDYVILHELCHLRHPDHGQGFHSLLEKLCTDNIVRLSLTEDTYVRKIISKINSSRSAHPVHKTLEREMKSYRLI